MPRGRIARPVAERFWEKVAKTEDEHACWEWTSAKNQEGYGAFYISPKKSAMRAHRQSWIFTFGPIPEGMLVCHHCDNPGCVRPSHLFLGTDLDNSRDMFRKGRWVQPPQPRKEQMRRGEKINFAKLTAKQVFQIRRLKLKGVSAYRVAKWTGLSVGGVCFINRGKTWAHVPFPRHEHDTLEAHAA